MLDIRKIEPRDFMQVAYLDQLAFSTHYRKSYGVDKLSERTFDGMQAYINRTGSTGLVMDYSGQTVGYIFLHQWGSLGWLGPVGIDPGVQGRGFGKTLIKQAIEVLGERQIREIGLETMVDSPVNIGLYMSLGFQPVHLTFDLTRPVKSLKEVAQLPARQIEPGVEFIHFDSYNEKGFAELAEISRDLTGSVIPGLDYLPELELLLKYGFGQVILMKEEGEPVGIGLVMTRDFRGQEGVQVTLRGLVVKPGTTQLEYRRLGELLGEAYQLTRKLGCSKVLLTVYTDNDAPTRYLLQKEHFTINFPYLRMVMNDAQFPVHRNGIELSKWRG